MRPSSRFAGGILSALLTGLIVVGSLSLALAEGQPAVVAQDSPTQTGLPAVQLTRTVVTQPAQTFTPTLTPTVTVTFSPPETCPIPRGWKTYTVLPGDTLDSLSQSRQITVEQILTANCLTTQQLIPNTVLYLPVSTAILSTSTPIVEPCGAPLNWMGYIVQPNDTLYRLSIAFRVGVVDIQRANCMGTSTIILKGDRIYVPNVPTTTPTYTPTSKAQQMSTSVPTSLPTDEPTQESTAEMSVEPYPIQ